MESVGNNIPRIDHDPVTHVCKGLLIEETRTNLLNYSEDFQTNWTLIGVSVLPNTTIAPDGTNSADILRNTSGITSLLERSITCSASTTNDYYATIYVKRGNTS